MNIRTCDSVPLAYKLGCYLNCNVRIGKLLFKKTGLKETVKMDLDKRKT